MRKVQLLALWMGILLLLLTGLFPAWGHRTDSGGFVVAGHWFLFSPPDSYLSIDYRRLLLSWAMIVVVTGGVTWSLSLIIPKAARSTPPAGAYGPKPQPVDPPEQVHPTPDTFPWRRPAYALYCWYLWLWGVLPFNMLGVLSMGLGAADVSPGLVRDWTVINTLALGAAVATLLYAQATFLRQMARSMMLFVIAFGALGLVGAVNLLIGIGTPDEFLREAAGRTGLGQLCGGGLFGFIAWSMNTPRYQRFFHAFASAVHQDARRPSPHRIGRFRLFRGVAAGRFGRVTPQDSPQRESPHVQQQDSGRGGE